MKTVVFVEDDRIILKDLKKIFISIERNYVFFSDSKKAMAYIKTHKVDLVCSDIYMPGLGGIDLLEKIKKNYPQMMRIAMIEFSNKKITKYLIEEKLVHHTIFKPWSKLEIESDVTRILTTQEEILSNALLAFIGEIESFPTLPEIYAVLTDLVNNHADIQEISNHIEKDIALTAFVLKVANSALYGRKTGNVSQAIMKIGLSNLKDIVLSYSVFSLLEKDQSALEEIWSKAMMTNKLLITFYTCCLLEELPASYASVGLLHDIGQLFLLTYKDKYNHKKNIDFPTHENLGGYLLFHWGLPLAYVEGAMFHHRPFDERAVHKKLVAALYVIHYYLDGFGEIETLEKIYDMLGLEREFVGNCLKTIIEKRP